MKFSCQQCSTAYNVPDEKVRGKRVRIKCKKCGAPIVVEGPPASAAASPKPIRSLQQTQVGGLVAPPDLASKIAAAKAAAAPKAVVGVEPEWSVAIDRANPSKMTLPQVFAAFAQGKITPKTLLWKKGLADWKPAFEIPEVKDALMEAGHSPGPATPAAQTQGFDEDEATRVVDSSSLPLPAAPAPRPKAKLPPPLPGSKSKTATDGDDDVVTSAPRAPAAAAPARNAFDDEEATAVIAPEKAQALLSAHEAASKPAQRSFAEDDEATRVLDAESIGKPSTSPSDRPTPESPMHPAVAQGTFEEEDDITQVATASVARELLEKAAPGILAANAAAATEAAPASRRAPSAEPLVVVSLEAAEAERAAAEHAAAEAKRAAAAAATARATNAQFTLQNEPTRIVHVRSKTNKASLIIGLLVVIVASAAGGFLASRFVPQRAPSGVQSR
jgi:predicted Zn finger-like uncharacterized protein